MKLSRAEYARQFGPTTGDLIRLGDTDLRVRDAGQYAADAPLIVGVRNISDPTVRALDFDGLLPDGLQEFLGNHTGEAVFAILALGLCQAAYFSEDLRSGLLGKLLFGNESSVN